MILGSIPISTHVNTAPSPSGRFFPVKDEDIFATSPVATTMSSSCLRSNKRLAYDECAPSDVDDEEESDRDEAFLSPPEIVRNKDDDKFPYRKIAVSNSSLLMHIRRLTEKLTSAKGVLKEANSEHSNATEIIVRLQEEVASANKQQCNKNHSNNAGRISK
jgi:hypothetical protein